MRSASDRERRTRELCASIGTGGTALLGPQSAELTAATQGGEVVRWPEGMVLSWCVLRATFGGPDAQAHYEQVVQGMQQATAEWEDACGVRFAYRPELDGSDVLRPEGVLFPVRELDAGGAFIASAFFPNDPEAQRRVLIDPSFFSPTLSFDPVGVLRHELGHVLGFRHEHIRSGAPPDCPGEEIGEALTLTDYDPSSVMHYFCGGVGDPTLQITGVDRVGAQAVYGPPLAATPQVAVLPPPTLPAPSTVAADEAPEEPDEQEEPPQAAAAMATASPLTPLQVRGFVQQLLNTPPPDGVDTMGRLERLDSALAVSAEFSAQTALTDEQVAGSSLVLSTASRLLAALNTNRRCVIAINNFLGRDLVDARTYIDSGRVNDIPVRIPAGGVGFVTANKTESAARGTVGVISYLIEGTSTRIALMWSVPYDRNLYDNWWRPRVMLLNVPTDAALFDAMYDEAFPANRSMQTTGRNTRISGIIGSSPDVVLEVSVALDS